LTEKTLKAWLNESYDYDPPRRGQIRDGVILRVEESGIIVDIGLKREGFVPQWDIDRLGKNSALQVELGHEVTTYIVNPSDRDGNLVLSVSRAQQEVDWRRAQELLESGEIWRGEIHDCNKGGLRVRFGRVMGFVPGSHLWRRDLRRMRSEQRIEIFQEYVGQELPLKIIEVERNRRRLILSERLARQQLQQQKLNDLLDELLEGQVCQGTVSRLCNFGAFVDLGGADGLVHISELSWARVGHPREVMQVGDQVDVYVLKLDHERKRIGLSLKRLQPDPWTSVDDTFHEGQLVSGVVTGVASFGMFVALETGIEGLVHISEISDPPPEDLGAVAQPGDELLLRILRIDPYRHRIGLSLKQASLEEEPDTVLEQA
jgi:small subunit ribosomal protein S1